MEAETTAVMTSTTDPHTEVAEVSPAATENQSDPEMIETEDTIADGTTITTERGPTMVVVTMIPAKYEGIDLCYLFNLRSCAPSLTRVCDLLHEPLSLYFFPRVSLDQDIYLRRPIGKAMQVLA